MHNYLRLDVWRRSYHLALNVYKATQSFPKTERYGLRQQLRRSATSIPTNIAEGTGRRHARDFAQFLRIALGSACELDTQLRLATDLEFLEQRAGDPLRAEVVEIQNMLSGLISHVLAEG